MQKIYPAIFSPNSDRTFTVVFPDLPGCITAGKDIANEMDMAEDALSQWLSYLTDEGIDLPSPSYAGELPLENGQFTTLIRGECAGRIRTFAGTGV